MQTGMFIKEVLLNDDMMTHVTHDITKCIEV